MVIKYQVNHKSYETELSNGDITVEEVNENNHYVTKVTAKKEIRLEKAYLESHLKIDDNSLYFANGYQSWTDTNEVSTAFIEKDVFKVPHVVRKAFAIHKYGDATFYNYSRATIHGYDVFYAKGKESYFSYSLNYKNAFLVYEINKITKVLKINSMVEGVVLKNGESFTIFDFRYFPSYDEGLAAFNQDFPLLNKEKILGYTSWYNYYQNINEEIILKDLKGLDERFSLFQIDDGYETFVGDWMDIDPVKFPNGLKDIAAKIHETGRKVGIWLAPLVAESKSKIFTEHPELFKKDNKGNPIQCGANWSGFYALDLENPAAWDYIGKCLTYFVDLGFDFFKLDFLYAASLPLYEGKSRAMVAYESYHKLREILKGKIILGCGATIFSSYQNFDYLRVGPDVSLKFDDVWFMKFLHRERISTKVTLQNTMVRYFMNDHLFGNDPDVFILRDENISLSPEQKDSLIHINCLFSNILMSSDNIKNYTDKQKETLEKALDIYYHATNKKFEKKGDEFVISYTLNGSDHSFIYQAETGVSKNG